MGRSWSLFGVLLLALTGAGRAQVDEAAFDAGLVESHRLAAAGDWSRAEEHLRTLLSEHEGQDYVLLRLAEVQDDLKRCMFAAVYEAPDTEDLISGDLISYEPRSGKIKLRYQRDGTQRAPSDDDMSESFRQLLELLGFGTAATEGDFSWSAGAPMHPIHFSGPYTVEISGVFPDNKNTFWYITPQIVLSLNPDEYFVIDFGYPYQGAVSNTWASGQIHHYLDGKAELVSQGKNTPLKAGKPYKIKIGVSKGKITASANGKSFLKATFEGDSYGQFGFRFCPDIREMNISGQANTAWLEGLADADEQSAWRDFEAEWAPDTALPAWLAERVGEGPPDLKAQLRGYPGDHAEEDEEIAAAVLEKIDEGKLKDAIQELRLKAVGDDRADLREHQLAILLEWTGDWEGAQEQCELLLKRHPDAVPTLVQRERLRAAQGEREQAIEELRALAVPGATDPAVYEELARQLLYDGRMQDADAMVREAVQAGAPPAYLSRVTSMIVRARRGPSWADTHEFKSRNYIVRSDLSSKAAAEAGKVLEQAKSLYDRVLGRSEGEDGEPDRYEVYLFAGSSGYRAYAADLFGSAPENTAGLYTPHLKQLLVWNLPDHEAMLRTVRHEGFHQYLDRSLVHTPTWFNEGTAEYFETAGPDSGRSGHGAALRSHVFLLADRDTKWAQFGDLIRMKRADFYAEPGLHYAQSWALVHYLLQSDRDAQKLFQEYFDQLLTGANAEAAANSVFGETDMRDLAKGVRAHIAALHEDFAR